MKHLDCILLVDDNHPTNFLNKKLIERLDLTSHVKIARNGEEALDYLTGCVKFNNQEFPNPDLIFMDINMPRMNGWEFLDAYRAKQFPLKKKPVIVMLTTSPNPADEEKSKQVSEISHFARKPLSQALLTDVMQRFFTS